MTARSATRAPAGAFALTVRQPWAWAILCSSKDLENRSWPWPVKQHSLPKRVFVHAALGMDRDEYELSAVGITETFGVAVPPPEALPLGAIVGAVTVTRCVSRSESPWFFGPFGFELERPVLLPQPVPCQGHLGIWPVPPDVLAAVRALRGQP